MDSEGKFWLWICVSVFAFMVVAIVSLSVNWSYNAKLVSQQNTCYGKVLQQSWGNDTSAILALHSCNGL